MDYLLHKLHNNCACLPRQQIKSCGSRFGSSLVHLFSSNTVASLLGLLENEDTADIEGNVYCALLSPVWKVGISNLWKLLIPLQMKRIFFDEADVVRWIDRSLSQDWAIVFRVTCYWVWRWQKEVLFSPDKIPLPVAAKPNFIQKYIVSLLQAKFTITLPCT